MRGPLRSTDANNAAACGGCSLMQTMRRGSTRAGQVIGAADGHALRRLFTTSARAAVSTIADLTAATANIGIARRPPDSRCMIAPCCPLFVGGMTPLTDAYERPDDARPRRVAIGPNPAAAARKAGRRKRSSD